MALSLAAELARRGSFRPVVANLTGTTSPELLDQVSCPPGMHLVDCHSPTRNPMVVLPKLLKLCRQFPPVVIHSHQVATFFWGAVLSRLYRAPIFCHVHSRSFFIANFRLILPFIVALAPSLTLIATSECVRDEMLERYTIPGHVDVQVLYNAIDPPTGGSQPRDRQPLLPEAWQDSLVVGFVGRLSPEKNVPLLLQAVSRLRGEAHSQRIKLVLTGDGPLREELTNQAKNLGLQDSTLFLGDCSRLAEIYPRLDLLVLPSQSEGFPLVCLEALAYGVPVICSDGVAAKEILAPYVGLVKADDEADLVRALREFLADPAPWRKKAELGREFVERCHMMGQYAEKLENLYFRKIADSNIEK